MNFSAAATAEAWAEGASWERSGQRYKSRRRRSRQAFITDGRSFMQIASLRDSHAEAARKARLTSEIILREPIR